MSTLPIVDSTGILGTQSIAPPSEVPRSLNEWLATRSVFESYAYSYPHKTAYRPLESQIALRELWENERRDSLFLYLHVPFCEMRCGFCNLFTQAQPKDELPAAYIRQLEVQAEHVRVAVGPAKYARVAFGGGTPTQLPEPQLEQLFDIAQSMGADLGSVPTALETSPETATQSKLQMVDSRGVERISIGIQSFVQSELKALGRPVTVSQGNQALERIRATSIPILNIDLIFGVPGQTRSSLLESVQAALRFEPEEVFLYPLYLRPLTGLGKKERTFEDDRIPLYRAARDALFEAGFEQVSLRMFRHPRAQAKVGDRVVPEYSCQSDGMIGLGCGARSYTHDLHYSDDWATGSAGVKDIIRRWIDRTPESFERAWYGYQLDDQERRTRFVIQSLLHVSGLQNADYEAKFGTSALADWPQLTELVELQLAKWEPADRDPKAKLRLTTRGFELSDSVGPWLYTDRVRSAMRGFELK